MSIVGYTRLARCALSEGGLYILIEVGQQDIPSLAVLTFITT